MKISKFGQKLKSSIRKRYVRKSEFEALAKDVKRLKKKLAQLEDCCAPAEAVAVEVPVAKPKAKKKQAEASGESTTAPTEDKLTLIKGIGPVLEKKLHALGITRFSQIADWNEEDVDKVSEHLSFKGRIQREEWIKQAVALLK